MSGSGIENESLGEPSAKRRRTIVRLAEFAERYRDGSPKSAETIAGRLVEHCFEQLVLGAVPQIFIQDAESEEPIDVAELYRTEFRPEAEARSFLVGGHSVRLLRSAVPRRPAHHELHVARKRQLNWITLRRCYRATTDLASQALMLCDFP